MNARTRLQGTWIVAFFIGGRLYHGTEATPSISARPTPAFELLLKKHHKKPRIFPEKWQTARHSTELLRKNMRLKKFMLTVVIVSFNSTEVIERCLSELLGKIQCQILIVDNASADRSISGFSSQFPNVDVILLGTNTGYGRAANVGLRMADTRYALLLNPDLKASPEQVEKLLCHAQQDTGNTAIWGPATRKENCAGHPPKPVKWVNGSAMLFDVEKIKEVGLFDENIFLFSEETDLCERTLKAGYAIKLCPDVFFDHLGGQSSTYSPEVEYMKWWHFGWSQCYRMTKHRQCTMWKNPQRKQITYRLHSAFSFSPTRRRKWRAKADGAQAFIQGKKAFTENDIPQMSTTS